MHLEKIGGKHGVQLYQNHGELLWLDINNVKIKCKQISAIPFYTLCLFDQLPDLCIKPSIQHSILVQCGQPGWFFYLAQSMARWEVSHRQRPTAHGVGNKNLWVRVFLNDRPGRGGPDFGCQIICWLEAGAATPPCGIWNLWEVFFRT